jgi:hypothetical protein
MGRKKKPENEKATKPGVSLDHECRIILSKILEWELSVQNNDLTASQAIRKCMRIAWQSHYEKIFSEYEAKQITDGISLLNEKPKGKAQNASVKAFNPAETLDGGSSTATKKTSRRAG